jgi:hypothetical protein
MIRQDLHNEDDLHVEFVLDESDGETWIELKNAGDGVDLTQEDDVVVALQGRAVEVVADSANAARARLGVWDDIEESGMELAVRVGEWFGSWELSE